MSRRTQPKQKEFIQVTIEPKLKRGSTESILYSVIQKLDYSKLFWHDHASATNQEPFEAKLLAQLWVVGYFYQIESCRGLEKFSRTHILALHLLNGLDKPGKSTLAAFRKKNLNALSELLIQSVSLAKELGLLSGDEYLDGTKIKANASSKKQLDRTTLQETKKKSQEHLTQYHLELQTCTDAFRREELQRKIDWHSHRVDQACAGMQILDEHQVDKINQTDPDTTIVKDDGAFYPGFVCEAMTDNQIVTWADVFAGGSDYRTLEPMIHTRQSVIDTPLRSVTADAGFENVNQMKTLLDQGLDLLIAPTPPTNSNQKSTYFGAKDFVYDAVSDKFYCPNNKPLDFIRIGEEKTKGGHKTFRRVYKSSKSDCEGCPLRSACLCQGHTRRTFKIRDDFEIIRENQERATNPAGRSRLERRKTDVEPVFGQIKGHIGLKAFHTRRLDNVCKEWRLICLGHNLRKIVLVIRKLIRTGWRIDFDIFFCAFVWKGRLSFVWSVFANHIGSSLRFNEKSREYILLLTKKERLDSLFIHR